MLSVRIDGREVETTPGALATLVFDGRVDRHSPSKTPGTTAERSLEQSLEPHHCEALSDELLHRLRLMYAAQSPEVDIQELCERVERLCQWQWTSPHVAARFYWAAAWLNDVLDRLENAAQFYDSYLQMSSREGHLRLLAYNNRGVLRIRLGRLEGVLDLARAAIPESAGQKEDPAEVNAQSRGLPAACFNLLNLINVSPASGELTRVVDEELADYFSQLSQDARTFWLGPATSGQEEGREESDTGLLILRDPSFRRLNTLTTRLAERATDLVCGGHSAATGRLSTAASQLTLWESRSDGEGIGPDMDTACSDENDYDRCAEAASLLLSEDIPSSLARLESPLARAEQAAREELAHIEGHLILNQHELAKSRLEAQRRILSSLNRRGRLSGLLARVDAQLERIDYLQSQREQLDLQKTCARLVSNVEQFCSLTDLFRAQREYEDLVHRLRDVRSELEPQPGHEVAVLLDELAARLDRHLHRLRRLEVRKGIRDALRQLRRNWPQDWSNPVPESVLQALAQCRLSDPQGWVDDWTAIEGQLDGHQGRHHLYRAVAALQAGQVSWDSVEERLGKALTCKPDLWFTIAPLFGLSRPSEAEDSPETAMGVQVAMHAAAGPLFDAVSQGTDASDAVGCADPMQRAGGLLERVFEQMEGRAARCMELWRCVAATLWPVLDGEDLDAIARVRGLAERSLDRWPMGTAELPGRADPRHPVSLFLESCDKARRLVEAGRQLNARPPQWDEAGKSYADLLGPGLDTPDQLRRAVTGYYLAVYHEKDAPHVQRQVLAGLETWAVGRSQEGGRQVRRQDVVDEIERQRETVSAGRPELFSANEPAAGEDCSNVSKGGGRDPQEKGKSEA